jgi:hypothetical protein
MEVVQIGDVTTGKMFGHYTTPLFGTENRNPNHRYAMQPIVLKNRQCRRFRDYFNGLKPTYQLKENLGNLMSWEVY